jgi:hypothetical protein
MFNTGQSAFDVEVNGVNLNVGSDLLEGVSVIENSDSTKPSVSLSFVDNKQAAQSFGLFQDGATVVVKVGNGNQDPFTYKFRQWGLDDISPKASGDYVKLSGVADLMSWFTSVVTKAHKGNSSEVAQKLAQEHGIPKIDVDGTQDKMTWLPDGRTVSQFVRNMIDHGHMGEGASPFKVLTSEAGEWMLRVKDIMKGGEGSHQLSSPGVSGGGDTIIWDYRIKSKGGALNSFVNYGYKVVETKIGGDPKTFFNIDINKIAGFMGISKEVSGLVDTARALYHPMAVGNTHDNYAKALHANTKSRATFSTVVELVITDQTKIKLLDDINIRLANSYGEVDQAYSGTYKVSAITRHISRGSYREKLMLTSQGTQASYGQ